MNIPVWDGWERGVLIDRATDGTLDAEYLTSAHIDHRPIVPRLLTLASNGITRGDVRGEIWIGFFAVLAGAMGLAFAMRRTFASPAWFWGVSFVVNSVLFSPLQYQNFLWAVQLAFLLPLGCLGLLLAVLSSGWKTPWKFVGTVVLAEIATFSFGHGLVLWPVAICFAALARDSMAVRGRLVFAGGVLLVGCVTLFAYFSWNYINTSQPPHAYGANPGEPPPAVDRVGNIKDRPERVTAYFWSSMGNPIVRLFGSDPAAVSVAVGRTCFWTFLVLLAWMLWRWREDGHWRALLPWAALGMFSIVVAALLATGRGAYLPFERSLMPRYLSLTMYLPIAITVFAGYLLHHYRGRGLALVLGAAFVALQSQLWVYGAHKMDAWKSARLQQRFQMLYAKQIEPHTPTLFDSSSIMNWEDGNPPFAIAHAFRLDELGLIRPPLFDEKGFGTFKLSKRRALRKQSDLVFARKVKQQAIYFSGFASLDDGRSADGVIAAWRRAGDGKAGQALIKENAKEKEAGEALAAAEWNFIDIIAVNAAPAMRASFYDGQFGLTPRNLSKLKNNARFEIEMDVVDLPDDAEIVFWVADVERMELQAIKRPFAMSEVRASESPVLLDEK